MPKFSLVTRIHVLTAIKIHDQEGSATFMAGLGFVGPADPVVIERGKRYPAAALLAYAHGRATGKTLTAEEVPDGAPEKVLGDLGFTIAWAPAPGRPPLSTPAPRPRAARVSTPKAPPKPEPVVRLCKTCHTQVPASGLCDYCD